MARLGDYLRQQREAKGISLDDLAARTRIRVHYLQAIEAGDWGLLPGEAYARAFVRSYARCLQLDEADVLVRYRAERGPLDHRAVLQVGPSGAGLLRTPGYDTGVSPSESSRQRDGVADLELRTHQPGVLVGLKLYWLKRLGPRLRRQWPWMAVLALGLVVVVQSWTSSRAWRSVPPPSHVDEGTPSALPAPSPDDLPWLSLLQNDQPLVDADEGAAEGDGPPPEAIPGVPGAQAPATSSDEAQAADDARPSSVPASPKAPAAGEGRVANTGSTDDSPATASRRTGEESALRLEVRSEGTSWARVKADGQVVYVGTLTAGQRVTWSAASELQVQFGRPEVVELALNGRPLGRPDRMVLTFTGPGPAMAGGVAAGASSSAPSSPASPTRQAAPSPGASSGPASTNTSPVGTGPEHEREALTSQPSDVAIPIDAAGGDGSTWSRGPQQVQREDEAMPENESKLSPTATSPVPPTEEAGVRGEEGPDATSGSPRA